MVRMILGILVMVTLLLSRSAGAQATFKTLHKFNLGKDGNSPVAGLIFDQAGNLYGTTTAGGAQGFGTVFQLTPNQNGGWTETVLYSFCSLTNCADGSEPVAELIFDQAGSLYGTTQVGGAHNNSGTVFQLTPNQNGEWSEHVLYSFCLQTNCADGVNPRAGLIFDQAGNLYGTTSGSLNEGGGNVFQLTPNQNGGWTEHVLYSFCSRRGCADGYVPDAGLIFDLAGNLYGTTSFGGAHNDSGTIFQLTPNQNGGWTESVLHSFCFRCAGGGDPEAGLIFDQAGNLYGTTRFGGAQNFGTVFELTPKQDGGWSYHRLHSFRNMPGAFPTAGLILDQTGNLYGTTFGYNGTIGSVFEITP